MSTDNALVETTPDKQQTEAESRTRLLSRVRTKKKRMFLQAFIANGGNISDAAECAGMSTSTHYQWLDKDSVYRQAFEQAVDESTDTLIGEAVRRATVGDEQPVYHKGELIGYRNTKSDNLLMFLLKQRDPSFRDNYTNQTNIGIMGGENVSVAFDIPRPPQKSEA